MKYLSTIDHDIIQLKYASGMAFEELSDLINEFLEFADNYDGQFNLLTDITDLDTQEILAQNITARSIMKNVNKHITKNGYVSKEAICGEFSNVLKNVIKIILSISGRQNYKFFKDRNKAIQWLRS